MAFASSLSRHGRVARTRKASSARRTSIPKLLAGGFAAVAIVVLSVAAVLGAGGWMAGASMKARSDLRTAVVPVSASGAARIGLAATGTAAPQTLAAQLPPRVIPAYMLPMAKPPLANPLGALALIAMDRSESADGEIVTGSLGAPGAVARSQDVAPVIKVSAPATSEPAKFEPIKPDGPRSTPLPLARPKLAAIGPVQNLGPKLEEQLHPPRTAVYDITGQTVHLPSGERLEAHSGLGSLMDDPRHVRVKNRGPTPPNVYALTLRESLFHGVQAIRLNPVDEDKMFNRDGILAHSYMLGPSGQSNGCVSFRDYPKFLRAFLRGEIDRIVVVERLDKPPAFAKGPALGPGVRSANAM